MLLVGKSMFPFQQLDHASEKALEKAMKTAMCTKLLQYYNVQTSEILNIAAFLDPPFKSLSFLEEVDKIATRLKCRKKLQTYSQFQTQFLRTNQTALILLS